MRYFQRFLLSVGFLFLTVACALFASYTLSEYPLLDFKFDDLHWTRAWLYMTIVDYYGVAIALSTIALCSEDVPYGLLWTLGFLLVGSPAACAYLALRLLFKSATLADQERDVREAAEHRDAVARSAEETTPLNAPPHDGNRGAAHHYGETK